MPYMQMTQVPGVGTIVANDIDPTAMEMIAANIPTPPSSHYYSQA